MNLFIDTNILLNIYHFSNDDIVELEQLSMLIRTKQINLITTTQLKNEFLRNRDSKVAVALTDFNRIKIDKSFPQVTRQYEEYKALTEAIHKFEASKKLIADKLTKDILSRNLRADKLIFKLFGLATEVFFDDDILHDARTRFDLGNPPGKKKSYGDAVNWQSLLSVDLTSHEDLYFISDDGDYQSEIDKSFNSYLAGEWESAKQSKIVYYKSLTEFFKADFPDIVLNDEYEKDLIIERLSKSGTFATTHSVIAQLSQYADFTKAQVDNIILAAISNGQVYSIRFDKDVYDTLTEIVQNHLAIIDPELLEKFNTRFAKMA